MSPELKEKIRKSMQHWLVTNGWPEKLKDEQIIQRLPEIWKKLESEGLLVEIKKQGFTYAQFVQSAIQAKKHADMKNMFEEQMRKMGFWK